MKAIRDFLTKKNAGAGKEGISYEEYSQLPRQSGGRDVGFVDQGDGQRTWGEGGAGILVVSPGSGEALLLKRSNYVQDPGVWGIPGGARRETVKGVLEDPLRAAVVESREEMGSLPKGEITREPYLYERPGGNFTFHTFVLEIDHNERELFVPCLNWENTEYRWVRWVERDSIGLDLHPGVEYVLENFEF